MSRYKLRANYDIENIDSQKMDGTVIVDVPMLSNGELNYGLSHIKKKLYEENVYPSEIGFDICVVKHGRLPRSTDNQCTTSSGCFVFFQHLGQSGAIFEKGQWKKDRKEKYDEPF